MLLNFTTNTTSSSYSSKGSSINVVASGTWGGATMAVQVLDPEDGSWVTVYSATADTSKNLLIGSGMAYRINISGGTAQDIDVHVMNVQSKDLNL